MVKKTEITRELALSIARTLDVSVFERKSSYTKDDAQANLSGRTHYVDDSTLKCFHSRIMSARYTDHGMLFAIVESVAADYQNKRRGFRFVVFDLDGTVVNDRASAVDVVSTSAKAEKDMWAFLDGFDVIAHYKKTLAYKADRFKARAAEMARVAKSLKA